MTREIFDWVLSQNLNTRTLVLFILLRYAGADGIGIIANTRMAGSIGITARSFRRTLTTLEGANLYSRVAEKRYAVAGPARTLESAVSGFMRTLKPLKADSRVRINGHESPPPTESYTSIGESSSISSELLINSENLPDRSESSTGGRGSGGRGDLDDLADLFGLVSESAEKRAPNGMAVEEMVDAWNDTARNVGLPGCSKITEPRRKSLLLVEERWSDLLAGISRSAFCLGEGPRGWRANIDFLCRPSNRIKLIEGFYEASGRARVRPGVADTDVALVNMLGRGGD